MKIKTESRLARIEAKLPKYFPPASDGIILDLESGRRSILKAARLRGASCVLIVPADGPLEFVTLPKSNPKGGLALALPVSDDPRRPLLRLTEEQLFEIIRWYERIAGIEEPYTPAPAH